MPPQSIDHPFYKHLKAAFIRLILSTIPLADRKHLTYLEPPPRVLHTGCWCSDSREPFAHNYTDCPNITSGPDQKIVASGVRRLRCNHVTQEALASHTHRLFCFDPAESAAIFMDWFMQPHAILEGSNGLDEGQLEAIQKCFREYEMDCPDSASRGHEEEKLDVLYRLLRDLRASDLTYEAQMGHGSWHVERVRAVLGWQDKSFDKCLRTLSWVMKVVRSEEADRRARREEAARRAKEARRDKAISRILGGAPNRRARREEVREEARRKAARKEEANWRARGVVAERKARQDEDRRRCHSRGHSKRH